MESKVSALIGGFSDKRDGKREVAVICPVGGEEQLSAFVRHVRKLGIDGKADFIFIFRPGLPYQFPSLSCFFAAENFPIGTSGCFFAGQALCHELGYKVAVMADLDAFLDCGQTFDSLVRTAQETGKATVPLSKSPEEQTAKGNYFVINQWGAIPRGVFENAGFCAPYMQKGGEDWEYSLRLRKRGLLHVLGAGSSTHPKIGMGVLAKMEQPGKYYSYLTGLMRAYLLSAGYSPLSYLRFLSWHCYYSFFADWCEDVALLDAIERSAVPWKKCSQVKAKGFAPHRLLVAIALVPYRFALGLARIAQGRKNLSSLPFPPTPANAAETCRAYLEALASG
jgi:hypothetical protein